MFERVKTFLNKISFELPRRSDVVVFDKSGADVLRSYVLSGIPFSIIEARYEVIRLHPMIIMLSVIRYLQIVINFSLGKGRLRPTDVLTSYYWAQLDLMKPKVVLTFIDTVSPFYRLSRLDKRAKYIAIQNGNRWHLVDTMAKAEIPHFFCFGEFEVNEYKRHNHNVNHFYPVGAIKGDYAGRTEDDNFPDTKFDLVLVSQWRDHIMVHNSQPDVRNAKMALDDFLLRFVSEFNLKLAIACALSTDAEMKYFNEKFKTKAQIFKNEPSRLSTYRLMQASKVVVTNWSTAGIEALGWGKKVFFCNLSNNPKNGFPTNGPWSLRGRSYDDFSIQLARLLKMEDADFLKISDDVRQLHMKYPVGEFSAGQLIHEAVRTALASNATLNCEPLILI